MIDRVTKTLTGNVLRPWKIHFQPCMTRTDSEGVVRRSCSPVTKEVDTCDEDSYGNRYCYCNSDLCNGSDPLSGGC